MLIFVVYSFIFAVESRFWEFRFVQPTRFSFSCSCAGVLANRTRPNSIVWSVLYDPVGPKTYGSRSLLLLAEQISLHLTYSKCYHVLTILPLRSATPIQDMNIHSAKSIGGEDTSAPIYWRWHIHILNRRGGLNLQDDYSAYMAWLI